MSPKSCLGCTKCFVFLVNLFFFFLGVLLLAFSFWVLFDRQSFAAVLGSPLVSLRVWSYGFSGVGIVTMFLGFLGCLGALKEVKVMLGLYFGLLLLLFAAQITVAVIIYTQRVALAAKVATYTEELIRGYPAQGPPGDPHESWDAVQQQLGCCGWKGPQDWDHRDDAARTEVVDRAVACSCLVASNSTQKTPWMLPHGRCPTAAPQDIFPRRGTSPRSAKLLAQHPSGTDALKESGIGERQHPKDWQWRKVHGDKSWERSEELRTRNWVTRTSRSPAAEARSGASSCPERQQWPHSPW